MINGEWMLKNKNERTPIVYRIYLLGFVTSNLFRFDMIWLITFKFGYKCDEDLKLKLPLFEITHPDKSQRYYRVCFIIYMQICMYGFYEKKMFQITKTNRTTT